MVLFTIKGAFIKMSTKRQVKKPLAMGQADVNRQDPDVWHKSMDFISQRLDMALF